MLEAFEKYHWPGNERELSNVIERGMILTNNSLITLRDIPPLQMMRPEDQGESQALLSLDEIENRHIRLVLENVGGNKTKAAHILGISRPKLYRKMDKYQIYEAPASAENK